MKPPGKVAVVLPKMPLLRQSFLTPPVPILLVIGGFGIFRLIYANLVNLSPQEAYYWIWSLHPSFSYFDHPPLVAYSIGLARIFFGDSLLAVRLPAVLYGTGSALLIYLLGTRIFGPQVGLVSVLLLNLILSFSLNFIFTTPDAPLLFFWCLTLFFLWKAVGEAKPGFWLPAGISFGLALLSKYTAVFLGASTLAWLLWTRELRPALKTRYPYLSVVLAFLIFTPVLLWNHEHQGASFLFQSADRAPASIGFSLQNFFGFLSSQMGMMNPLVFLGIVAASLLAMRRNFLGGRVEEKFLLAYTLPILLFFALVATQDWVKINWPIPGYPPLILLFVGYYEAGHWPARWVRRIYAPVLFALAVFPFLLLHALPFMKSIEVPGSVDTLTGWPEVAAHVSRLRQDLSPQGPLFVSAWNHKNAAELQFYLPGHEEVYTQNILGEESLAYDFWFDPRPLVGKNAIFVWADFDALNPDREEKLRKVFAAIRPLPPMEIHRGAKTIRVFHFYYCSSYSLPGSQPATSRILPDAPSGHPGKMPPGPSHP